MNERLLIIDTNNLAVRAYWVGDYMEFFNMVGKLISQVSPHYLAFAADSGEEGWRRKEYPDYKSDRQEKPPELTGFLINLPLALQDQGLAVASGPEADDEIYSIVLSAENIMTYIASSDTDLLSLVSGDCKVISFGSRFADRVLLDTKGVREKMGLLPWQIPFYNALKGGHDNLPGCPGVGKKSAITLLQEFSHLDNLYENLDDIELIELRNKAKIRKNLETYKDDVYMSYELGRPRPTTEYDIKTFTYDQSQISAAAVQIAKVMQGAFE